MEFNKKVAVGVAAAAVALGAFWLYKGSCKKTCTKAGHKKEKKIVQDTTALKELFNTFDRNDDGTLSFKELRTSLERYWGEEFTDDQIAELEKIVKQYDINKNGSLEFKEFKKIESALRDLKASVKRLRDVFDSYDVNGDGSISFSELRKCMDKATGGKLTIGQQAELERLLKEADVDHNGSIDFYEFAAFEDVIKHFTKTTGALRQEYNAIDNFTVDSVQSALEHAWGVALTAGQQVHLNELLQKYHKGASLEFADFQSLAARVTAGPKKAKTAEEKKAEEEEAEARKAAIAAMKAEGSVAAKEGVAKIGDAQASAAYAPQSKDDAKAEAQWKKEHGKADN